MKKMNKIIFTTTSLSLLVAPVATMVACGSSSSSAEIGFTNYNFADTFMKTVQKGIEDTAKTLGTSVASANSTNSQAEQNKQVDAQINAGVKGLLVNLVEPGSAQAIVNKAKTANIPIVLVNKEPLANNANAIYASYTGKIAYIGSNLSQAGQKQAELIFDDIRTGLIKDKNADGKLGLVILGGQKNHADAVSRTKVVLEHLKFLINRDGLPATSSLGEIAAGSMATWAEFFTKFQGFGSESGSSEYTENTVKYVADTQNADWSVNGGKAVVQAIETANANKLDMVIGNNDDTALGASQYYFGDNASSYATLETQAKIDAYIAGTSKNYMPIYGIDSTDAAKTAIRAGKLAGTVLQDGVKIGATAITAIYNLVKGNPVNASFPTGITQDTGQPVHRVSYDTVTRAQIWGP